MCAETLFWVHLEFNLFFFSVSLEGDEALIIIENESFLEKMDDCDLSTISKVKLFTIVHFFV